METANRGVVVIKEKLFVCTVKEDKGNPKRECLATELYRDRFDVLWYGMWRPFFRKDLESVRTVTVTGNVEEA